MSRKQLSDWKPTTLDNIESMINAEITHHGLKDVYGYCLQLVRTVRNELVGPTVVVRPRWEYTTLSHSSPTKFINEDQLTTMGRAGWELISVKWTDDGYIKDAVLKRSIA